jgi:hypothetical protein
MRRMIFGGLATAFLFAVPAGAEGVHIIALPGATATAMPDYAVPLAEDPSGVPEPAVWAMMIFGFGVVGGMLRRARATTDQASIRDDRDRDIEQ